MASWDHEDLKQPQYKKGFKLLVPKDDFDFGFTGVDVPRMDWWTGDIYTLRLPPEGADLSLLNNGAAVLDHHQRHLQRQHRGAQLAARQLQARGQFAIGAARPEDQPFSAKSAGAHSG